MDITAGLAKLKTQINKLERRIHNLDMNEVDTKELHSAIESLNALKARYKEMQEEAAKKKESKEQALAEIPVESATMLPTPPLPEETPTPGTPSAEYGGKCPKCGQAESWKGGKCYNINCGYSIPSAKPTPLEQVHQVLNAEPVKEAAPAKLKCPHCGSENVTPAFGHKLNKCDSCHWAFDLDDDDSDAPAKEAAPLPEDMTDSLEETPPIISPTPEVTSVSLQDIYEDLLKQGNDEHTAMESALSLMTMGAFDAIEGESREKLITESLAKVTSPSTGQPLETTTFPKREHPPIKPHHVVDVPTPPQEKESEVMKYAIHDVVEPSRGTPGSKGRVMGHDEANDMVYVAWDSGKLKDDHGYGAYSSKDLKKSASHGRHMGIKDLGNGSFAVVHTDTGHEVAMFDSKEEAKEYINKNSSQKMAERLSSKRTAANSSSDIKYVIEGDEGFWSNDIGWVFDKPSATIFTAEEIDRLNLPIGKNVRWVQAEHTEVSPSPESGGGGYGGDSPVSVVPKGDENTPLKTSSLSKVSISVEFAEGEYKEEDSLENLKKFLNSKFKNQEQMEQQVESLCAEWAMNNNFFMKQREDGSILFTEKHLGQDFEPRTMTKPLEPQAAVGNSPEDHEINELFKKQEEMKQKGLDKVRGGEYDALLKTLKERTNKRVQSTATEEAPENEPTEDDIFIQDSRGQTSAWYLNKPIASLENDDWDAFFGQISDWMDANNYTPTVWNVSDHGNVNIDNSFYEYAQNRQLEQEKPALETVSGAHVARDVILNGKVIETVFYEPTSSAEDVKRGLIEHDGYSPSITVRQRQRASLEITAKEHKLVVKSLDDAMAECSAGDWHFSATGARTRAEIEEQFKKHMPKHEASLQKSATVTHRTDGWHVLSEEGKNLGGPYKSKEEAVKRLRQVEYFKHNGSLKKAEGTKIPLNVFDGGFYAIETSGDTHGYAIFNPKGEQKMVITTEAPISQERLESIVHDEYGKRELVRATLKEDSDGIKAGTQLVVSGINRKSKQIQVISNDTRVWLSMDKVAVGVVDIEQHIDQMKTRMTQTQERLDQTVNTKEAETPKTAEVSKEALEPRPNTVPPPGMRWVLDEDTQPPQWILVKKQGL